MAKDSKPKTLYDKIFDRHVVAELGNGLELLYIDRHLIYECTSPQAFAGLRTHGRNVRRPDLTLATSDHTVPTTPRNGIKRTSEYITDKASRLQCAALARNTAQHGIAHLGLDSTRQGIVHVIGPELGFTQPGVTLVCGDSHTSTHGAFGALAFGIGTSEVEHVLATQTLSVARSRTFLVQVAGQLAAPVVCAKDLVLHLIALIGTAGATGTAIEFAGSAVRALSMDARMSLCNMAIEAGARTGLVAPDDTTIEYLRCRPCVPKPASDSWERAVADWTSLRSDPGAHFDRVVHVTAAEVVPMVTWGTSPEHAAPATASVPSAAEFARGDEARRRAAERALEYMGLEPGTPLSDIRIDVVFIGSCTNARLEDLRAAARVLRGRRIAPGIRRALVVPGSGTVRKAAEEEGLSDIFVAAGCEWREAGCSLCCGMNGDSLKPYERCASTSNRNFEHRQGERGRTHLMSPAMAAAAAVTGRIVDVRELQCAPENKAPSRYLDLELRADDDDDDSTSVSNGSETDEEEGKKEATPPLRRPLTTISGLAAPLPRANIDTDLILPVQFCKTLSRDGAGLFNKLRHLPDGSPDPQFVLNREPYASSSRILVGGPNFGCGSSREHAVWAIQGGGIACVVAPSFADIFASNAFRNGLLTAKVPDAEAYNRVLALAEGGHSICVDLRQKKIFNERDGAELAMFEIEEYRRQRLLDGTDDISATLTLDAEIGKWETERRKKQPWVDEGAACLRDMRKTIKELRALVAVEDNGNALKW